VLAQLLTSKEVYKVFSKKLQPEGPESLPKACLLVERMTHREVAVFLENKHMLHHVLKLERGDLSGWVFNPPPWGCGGWMGSSIWTVDQRVWMDGVVMIVLH
jgi:hypothetical protein